MQIITYDFFEAEKASLYDDIYALTSSLKEVYPDYHHWFYHTFLEGLKQKQRICVVAKKSGQIVGCALLKKGPDEKKLSTIFVHPDFHRQGIGTRLMQKSVELLDRPILLTVSDDKLSGIQPLLTHFHFYHTHQRPGVYTQTLTEHYFIRDE